MKRVSAVGPLCEFATVRKYGASPVMCRMQGMGPAGAGLRRRRPAARGALRYSPWGRAAELSSLAALVALEQLRRVSLRSARVRAPTPGLRSSPSPTQPGAGRPHALRETIVLGESVWPAAGVEPAAGRARCPAFELLQQRTGGASPSRGRVGAGAPVRRRGAQGFGRRAYPRACTTDSLRLFERNERSE